MHCVLEYRLEQCCMHVLLSRYFFCVFHSSWFVQSGCPEQKDIILNEMVWRYTTLCATFVYCEIYDRKVLSDFYGND